MLASLISPGSRKASLGCRAVARALSEPHASPGKTKLHYSKEVEQCPLLPTPTQSAPLLLLGKSYANCYDHHSDQVTMSIPHSDSPKRERAMSWLRPSISIEHTASNTEGLIWMVKEGDPANGRALPLGWEAGEP